MGINKFIGNGRITKDLELKTTGSGKKYLRFNVAINRNFDSGNGESNADFIPCVVWEKTAENAVKFLKKSSKVGIEGMIQTGSYESEGKTVYSWEVVVSQLEYLDPPSQSNNQQVQGNYQQQQQQQGGFPQQNGGFPQQQMGGGFPQQQGGFPQQNGGFPQQQQMGGFPQGQGGFPQQNGGFPQQQMGGGFPQQQQGGYPQMNNGGGYNNGPF